MSYNTHEYTLRSLLDDEIDYFNNLLNIKKDQFIFGGEISEIVDNEIVPIRGNAKKFNYLELSHAVYLTKKHFNRIT